ncbi:Inositol phosphoceramide mannosyltransferase 1 [Hondaea fermentalgiana]|uniref:Inositol phosphoceramide mannosyltransferase 1 n=1 Tax=Hondaea fermentalgiana TaxID=2315210 RepID=A0A2R5G557_9STRA|nr:Inositol phosphoceramide mannosyltransferase 1 [Hondaea fermentalgiana]|eukprot:GBG26110.1 Inositol phosphoceramide mannosyltransferase 1 [Hondaea fermentalgiana]
MLSRRPARATSGGAQAYDGGEGGSVAVDIGSGPEDVLRAAERAHLLHEDDSGSNVTSKFASIAGLRGASGRDWQSKLARALRWIALALLAIAVLNTLYLTGAWLFFTSPCDVALRTQVQLAREPRKGLAPSTPSSAARGVPKIIHQQWKNEIVPEGDFTKYHNLWKTYFPEPEYTHMLWTDESGRALIATDFPWFLEAYDNFYMNIQRADAVRYFVLYKYGGIYADLDYEPFTNFWEHIPQDRVSLIESPYKINEQVQNSLMAGPKGDPFWNVTFSIMYERRKSHKVLSSTGPSMVDEAMRRAPDTTWYHMLPCENFHRIPLGEAGKNAPGLSRFARALMAYSPLVKTCGDWHRKDDCQFGLHHNAVSYMSNMGDGMFEFLFNF